jgi:riboflavin synthase alpha subunit
VNSPIFHLFFILYHAELTMSTDTRSGIEAMSLSIAAGGVCLLVVLFLVRQVRVNIASQTSSSVT